MKKITDEKFELSTGKVIYPRCANPILFELKSGDGGKVGDYYYEVEGGHSDSPDLTKKEARELALYMSELWMGTAINLK